MSAAFSRWSAMVKARGAEMSSRQIAPKVGASAAAVLHDLELDPAMARQIGKASMPAKVLKMTLLPSAIGSAASGGPPSRPKRSEPSVRMATVLPRQVRSKTQIGIAGDFQARFGDAGGVDQRENRAVANRHLAADADQAPVAPPIVEPLVLLIDDVQPDRSSTPTPDEHVPRRSYEHEIVRHPWWKAQALSDGDDAPAPPIPHPAREGVGARGLSVVVMSPQYRSCDTHSRHQGSAWHVSADCTAPVPSVARTRRLYVPLLEWVPRGTPDRPRERTHRVELVDRLPIAVIDLDLDLADAAIPGEGHAAQFDRPQLARSRARPARRSARWS